LYRHNNNCVRRNDLVLSLQSLTAGQIFLHYSLLEVIYLRFSGMPFLPLPDSLSRPDNWVSAISEFLYANILRKSSGNTSPTSRFSFFINNKRRFYGDRAIMIARSRFNSHPTRYASLNKTLYDICLVLASN